MVYPIAGVRDATRPGLGVEENVALLRRYLYAEQRLCLLLAGHLPSVPEMAIKQGIGRHLWEDAEHASWLVERIGQLRTSRKSLDEAPDGALAVLFDELLWSANSPELITGAYAVVKPALLVAYRWHISVTNPLVDFPTARLLRFVLMEEEAQAEWAASALPGLPVSAELTAWRSHLERLLAACGSMTGREQREPLHNEPLRSAAGQPQLSMYPVREPGRPTVFDPPPMEEEADPIRRGLVRKMVVRYNEMKAVENIASTMYETPGMPWLFYHDLARHLWDEVRHTCFGEVMLQQLGCDVAGFPFVIGNSVFYSMVSPLERYALLGISIEGGAMKYPPGKRQEFEWCRDIARDALAAVFQDYDWADEVLHTQIARKWIGNQLSGDLNKARAIAADTKERLQQFKVAEEAKERAAMAHQHQAEVVAVPTTERHLEE